MAADQLGCKVHSEDSIVLFTPLKTNLKSAADESGIRSITSIYPH